MKLLAGMLAHDRPYELSRSLSSLLEQHSGKTVVHLDGQDPDVIEVLKDFDQDISLEVSPEPVGIAAGLNKILAHRKDEALFRLDSDTELVTPNLLDEISAGVGAFSSTGCVAPGWSKDLPQGVGPGRGLVEVDSPCSGAWYYPAHAIELLGEFTVFGRYGFEDQDAHLRLRLAGLWVGYDTNLEVHHWGQPTKRAWQQHALNDLMPVWKLRQRELVHGDHR